VLELAGIKDVLAKSLGSNNSINVVKATMRGINEIESYKSVLAKRDLQKL